MGPFLLVESMRNVLYRACQIYEICETAVGSTAIIFVFIWETRPTRSKRRNRHKHGYWHEIHHVQVRMYVGRRPGDQPFYREPQIKAGGRAKSARDQGAEGVHNQPLL